MTPLNTIIEEENTPDTEWREVQVGDRVICDGLSTGKIGKVLGLGSSEHSIKLLVEGVERYEPDYALLEVTAENKRAVELLLSHYSQLTTRDTYWKERVRERILSNAYPIGMKNPIEVVDVKDIISETQ